MVHGHTLPVQWPNHPYLPGGRIDGEVPQGLVRWLVEEEVVRAQVLANLDAVHHDGPYGDILPNANIYAWDCGGTVAIAVIGSQSLVEDDNGTEAVWFHE